MKKFLLSLLALFVAFTASAQTVTFDATVDKGSRADSNDAGADQVEKDGVTIAISSGLMGLGTHYRCYKGQTLTISSSVGKIISIDITCTVAGDAKYGPGCFTAAEGNYMFDDKIGSWEGEAETVVLTATTNQVRMTRIDVTYSTGGETTYVAAPRITPASGTYYDAQEVSMTAGEGTTIKYTLNAGDEQTYSAPFTLSEAGTYAIAAYAVDAQGNKSSDATSTITIAKAPEYTTIAEMRAACTAEKQADAPTVILKFDELLVTGAKNQNVFVTDGKQSYLIYGSNAKGLGKGDKISGSITGLLYKYNQLGELAVSDGYENVTVISSGNEVSAEVFEISDVVNEHATLEASYVQFQNVTFAADKVASKTIAITDGEGATINLYDNYSTFTDYTFDTTKNYNVSCYVANYKGTVQCYLMDESDLKILSELIAPQAAWSAEKESLLVGATAEAKYTTDSDAQVTYTSSNEAVATVTAEGVITAVGAGTCTITASTAETEKYLASNSSITITVTESMGGLETFANGDFENWGNETQPAGWKSSTSASSATLEQSTDAHGGQYACLVKHVSGSNKRLASKEYLLPAGWYTFQFYAKSANETLAEARPGYAPWDSEKGALGTYVYGDYTAPLSQTEWTLVSFTFQLEKETQINLVVMNPKDNGDNKYGDLLLDDVDFRAATQEEIDYITGIKAVQETSANKALFNIAGQRVNENYKGIVIQNGKKFLK